MRKLSTAVLFALLTPACNAQDATAPIDDAAIFTAAGFSQQGDSWRKCDDPGTLSYTPGAIEQSADVNGDGRPEYVVTEGGTYCYGHTGTAFTLVSQQEDGTLRVMAEETGMPGFLKTSGTDGWPDLQIGGPGFCFPVLRWNGTEYALNRHEYEGQACNPEF